MKFVILALLIVIGILIFSGGALFDIFDRNAPEQSAPANDSRSGVQSVVSSTLPLRPFAPSTFKGPTGPPRIIGPSGPPPGY